MMNLLTIAFGGALGALSRYGITMHMQHQFQHGWPAATLLINVLGSALIGVMYVLIVEKSQMHESWRYVSMVGFLGAFTTFSTFSLEVITLLENGQPSHAIAYIIASLILGIGASWGAILLTRLL
jgi:CrcB protein